MIPAQSSISNPSIQKSKVPAKGASSQTSSALKRQFDLDVNWRTLFALIDTKKFDPKLSAIARQLGLSIEEANDALEALIDLKLIKRTEHGFQTLKDIVEDTSNSPEESRQCWLSVNSAVMEKMADISNSSFTHAVFAINRSKTPEMMREIRAVLTKYMEMDATSSSSDVVIGISLGCAILTSGDK